MASHLRWHVPLLVSQAGGFPLLIATGVLAEAAWFGATGAGALAAALLAHPDQATGTLVGIGTTVVDLAAVGRCPGDLDELFH